MKDGNNQTSGSPFAGSVGGTAVVASQTSSATTNEPLNNQPSPVMAGNNLNITPAKKSNPIKWVLLIGLPILMIIVCVLVWYFAFFNNKYNVVRQALYSMMDNREDTSNFNLSAKSSTMTVSGNGVVSYLKDGTVSGNVTATMKSDSMSLTMPKIDYAVKGSEAYFKVKLNDDMKKSGVNLGSLDNQWLKVDLNQAANSASSLDSSEGSSSGTIVDTANTTTSDDSSKEFKAMQKCFAKASDKLDEKAAKKQVVDSLLNTKFVTVDDSKSDSKGKIYQISLDDSKAGDFLDKFGETDYYKTFADCAKTELKLDKTPTIPSSSKDELKQAIKESKPTFKLWVQGFNREVKQASLSIDSKSGDETATVSLTVDFAHQKPSISMPSGAKDLQKALEENPEVLQGISSSLGGGLAANQADDAVKRDVSSVVEYVTDYSANNPGTSLGSQVLGVYTNGQPVTTTPLGKFMDTLSSKTTNVVIGPVTANPTDLQAGNIWILTGGKCDSITSFSAANSDKQYVVLTRLSDNSLYCQDAS